MWSRPEPTISAPALRRQATAVKTQTLAEYACSAPAGTSLGANSMKRLPERSSCPARRPPAAVSCTIPLLRSHPFFAVPVFRTPIYHDSAVCLCSGNACCTACLSRQTPPAHPCGKLIHAAAPAHSATCDVPPNSFQACFQTQYAITGAFSSHHRLKGVPR